jgi:glycosyltransferase involved in cell wall biosynthesis/2-polyprenyl-3-methyl-5-hydroxy-6-metoxy-1,4-benzoquinol methylase
MTRILSPGPAGKRIGVVCHELSVAGSLFRFERFGRVARRLGHQIAFIRLSTAATPARETDAPVLSFDEAARETWDVTIVPGASFPEETMSRFDRFESATFGLRMQHVLNDQTRKPAFLRVNALFKPHVVVFNNRHWPPGSFTSFAANAFHFCEGGVDLQTFASDPHRLPAPAGSRFLIGGLAHKNPMPLIEAVHDIGFEAELRLYGPADDLPSAAASLVDRGCLRRLGPLSERELPGFYRDLDCVVHTRTHAGWANLAAEAMACGIPVICTPHGTLAFAEHEQTALVIQEPTAEAIRAAIDRLRRDPHLARRLSHNARQRISGFSWERYTAELLRCMEPDAWAHYTWAPELGLFGKWPVDRQIRGLESVIDRCEGKSVLDIGSAEGMIARCFLERGAALVHGFDRDAARVTTATALCRHLPNGRFWPGDVSVWSAFLEGHAAHLQERYDIVLYLGLHHDLPKHRRRDTLAGAAGLASGLLVVRTPERVFDEEEIGSVLAEHGFDMSDEARDDGEADAGIVRVFERRSRRA